MGLTSRRNRAMRRAILATSPPICHLCTKPIDLTLSGNHREGPTLDHLVCQNDGGTDHPSNLKPAHQHCNSRRRNAPLAKRNSRDW